MYKNKKGFTLIELLVVIGIIAVLAGVVVVALNPLERIRESRDSRRLQDIQAVRQAIDLGLADGQITLAGTVAARSTGNSDTGSTAVDGSGWVGVVTVTAPGLAKYMPALPVDPVDASQRDWDGYTWESDGTDYVLTTGFETTKYQTSYGQTDGLADNVYQTGTKSGLTW